MKNKNPLIMDEPKESHKYKTLPSKLVDIQQIHTTSQKRHLTQQRHVCSPTQT